MGTVTSNPATAYDVKLFTTYSTSQFYLDITTRGKLDTNLLGPAASTGTGTSIASDVISIDIQRGTRRTTDRIPAGSCTISFYDPTRKFDPTNTAGTFYGDLGPNYLIEVYCNTRTIFSGWVTNWDYSQRPGSIGEATVRAVDSLSLYGNAETTITRTFGPQLTGTRITSLLELSNFPSSAPNIAAGTATVQTVAYPAGTNVLAAIGDVAEVEWGALFTSRSGALTFRNRTNPGETAVVKLSSEVEATFIQYLSIQSTHGDETYPTVTVADYLGGVESATDLDFIIQYGNQTLNVTPQLLTVAAAQTLANDLLAIYGEPQTFYDNCELVLTDTISQADQNKLFELELQNPVRVKQVFPTGSPGTIDDEFRLQAVSHRITKSSHTMNLSFGLPS